MTTQALERIEHVPAHRYNGPRGSYRIRTAEASDAASLKHMLEESEPEDIRMRFFRCVRYFPDALVEPMLQADESRHFAFVAIPEKSHDEIVGSGMLVVEPDGGAAEFALMVARAHAGQGVGTHLLHCLVQEARAHGVPRVYGVIMAENANMIELARHYGFRIGRDANQAGCVRAEIEVARAPQSLDELSFLPGL